MQRVNRRGVTLIELIIVMVIIAIGALLISPNFGRWVSHYRLRTATRDIVSTLRLAQMKAVSNNMHYRVNFDSAEIGATNSYILQYNTGGAWINEGVIQGLPSAVIYNGITFPANHAEFNPNSSSSAGAVRIQAGAGTSVKSIKVGSTGRITIAE